MVEKKRPSKMGGMTGGRTAARYEDYGFISSERRSSNNSHGHGDIETMHANFQTCAEGETFEEIGASGNLGTNGRDS